MSQRVIVFEVNEVPLRIYRHFQKTRPGSNVDRLLQSSRVLETMALDVPESFLYPSQTWASLNTGAPYDSHQIHWYNDPKPRQFPLYWRTMAEAGLRVGAVNTLHSSPAEGYAETNPNYAFVIPDCFAADSYTKPRFLEPFQALNLKAVAGNSRAVSMRVPMREAVSTLAQLPRYGIQMSTLMDGASLVSQIVRKKTNRERLRNLQFPLVADIFLKQVRKHDPDLAILFTNHVAANLHRYWYALFPQDYSARIYDEGWVRKYSGEVLAAVDLLDKYLGHLMELAEKTDRVLVLVSSMGQHANPNLTPEFRQSHSFDFRLEDVRKLVSCITGGEFDYRVESAMVPQYSLEFPSLAAANECAQAIQANRGTLRGINLVLNQKEHVLTISVLLDSNRPDYEARGKVLSYSELGFVRFEVDDHHSGCHCPDGSLIIYNSKTSHASKESINYLEYAPALLKHFGLPANQYMVEPSFSL